MPKKKISRIPKERFNEASRMPKKRFNEAIRHKPDKYKFMSAFYF